MSRPNVVVAAGAVLDIEAARRLADYDDLDDAGITRAVEQVHTQRWGRWDLPAHLAALDSVSVIVVDRGGLSRHDLNRDTHGDERGLLAALANAVPAVPVDLVDWDGHDIATLVARFIAADMLMPAGLAQARRHHLAGVIAPTAADHPAPDRAFEDECQAIFGARPAMAITDPLIRRVHMRTRLWWAQQYATRHLPASRRHHLAAQLERLERP